MFSRLVRKAADRSTAAAPGGCFHSPMCGVSFSLAWALADVMSGTDGSFFFLAFSCLRFVAPVSTLCRRPLPNDDRAVEQRVDGLPEVPGLDWGDIGPRGASMAMVVLEAARRVLTRAAAAASCLDPMEELLGDRCASERQPRRRRVPY